MARKKQISLASNIPNYNTKAFDKNEEEFSEQLADWQSDIATHFTLRSVWSYKSVRDFNKIAFKGTFTICYKEHWGDVVEPIKVKNPTFLDLWKAADKLIRMSGDTHHIFIEDFKKYRNKLTLWTGS
jgi:hypothetical protein